MQVSRWRCRKEMEEDKAGLIARIIYLPGSESRGPGDLIQPWAPSLITQVLMLAAELAGDAISLSRPRPSAASARGTRCPTNCWLPAGRVRERMRHKLSWQSLPTDVHLGFGVVVVYSHDVKEYHRACFQTVWL